MEKQYRKHSLPYVLKATIQKQYRKHPLPYVLKATIQKQYRRQSMAGMTTNIKGLLKGGFKTLCFKGPFNKTKQKYSRMISEDSGRFF